MKKLLFLLGTTALLTSASSAVITTTIKPTDNDIQFDNLKIKKMVKVMVKADKNHNGVSIKFQQFLIPKEFSAR